MNRKVEEFRKRAREENRGRVRIRWRYSGRVRSLAVAHLCRVLDAGGSLSGAARTLGVRPLTLKRWHESEGTRGTLRPVEIVEESSMSKTVLLSPRGYRVEGLSEEGLSRLLEHLG
jgi:transposase-like protein